MSAVRGRTTVVVIGSSSRRLVRREKSELGAPGGVGPRAALPLIPWADVVGRAALAFAASYRSPVRPTRPPRADVVLAAVFLVLSLAQVALDPITVPPRSRSSSRRLRAAGGVAARAPGRGRAHDDRGLADPTRRRLPDARLRHRRPRVLLPRRTHGAVGGGRRGVCRRDGGRRRDDAAWARARPGRPGCCPRRHRAGRDGPAGGAPAAADRAAGGADRAAGPGAGDGRTGRRRRGARPHRP